MEILRLYSSTVKNVQNANNLKSFNIENSVHVSISQKILYFFISTLQLRKYFPLLSTREELTSDVNSDRTRAGMSTRIGTAAETIDEKPPYSRLMAYARVSACFKASLEERFKS